jgi:MtrB/PioB family decaheme-associated outer membrane protein
MKRMAYAAAFVLVLAVPALAQSSSPADEKAAPGAVVAADATAASTDPQRVTPPPGVQSAVLAEPWTFRQVDLGFFSPHNDTGSGKFLEYRSIPEYGAIPFVRFAGNERFRYDFAAWNALQDTARYQLRADPGPLRIQAQYQRVPHLFGTANRSVLDDVGAGSFTLADAQQQQWQRAIEQQYATNRAGVNFTFLNNLLRDGVSSRAPIDVRLLRQRGQVDIDLTRDAPVAVRLSYFQENRRGNRGAGTSFGFSNVVETAEPIDYRTRDLGLTAEWTQPWGLVRGAAHFNQFTNHIAVQTFDNPFRATDATDASAYSSPGSGSIGGASFGRLALPPDNKAMTGSLGAAFKFSKKARLTVDASLGQWTQDEAFIPFTTNGAITKPFLATDPSHLPARSLDGEIGVFSFSSTFNARPARGLVFNARYRRYDLDNKTPRIEFHEGYVRFDAVWEEIPRISVPYAYTTDNAASSLSYNFGPVTLEGGYKYDRWQREFRETGETTQNTFYGSANVRPASWAVLRATYERGSRSYDEYDTGRSEHASYLEAEDLANLAALRRFDQAERDTDRLISSLQLSPGGNVTLGLGYVWGREDYSTASHGLLKADSRAFSADVDYTPTARVNLFAFYTREDLSNLQRGRQSGATPSVNPLDDWTSDVSDQADSFGGGLNLGLVPDKLDLKLLGNYQKVDGNNALSAPTGGAPDVARRALGGVSSIAAFDDTRLWSVNAELAYALKGGWTVVLGSWFEDYELADAASVGSINYVPGGLFLAGNDGNYQGRVIYTRLSYAW